MVNIVKREVEDPRSVEWVGEVTMATQTFGQVTVGVYSNI